MGRDLLDAVARRPADLVVIDCLMFGALDAARRAGLRYAVLEHFYDGYYERGCLRGPLGLSLRLRRLAPRRALQGALARVVTSVPELDPAASAAPWRGLTYVGPVVDVRPRIAAEPAVLVSLSTFSFPGMRRSLQNVADATRDLGVRVVVTTGHAVDPAELRVAPHVEVHRFVPHVELMPHVSLLIGHGGHGTTMQALAHDLPVLVMPMGKETDQPMVGRSVAAAGAGRVLAKTAPPAAIAATAADLLADGPHRAAAARLGTAIRSRPGTTGGADALEGVLSTSTTPRRGQTWPTRLRRSG
jgi:UDP:flavonoid glycosyltransferase YjiC (YdhE family)